jgi:hypothetical protein
VGKKWKPKYIARPGKIEMPQIDIPTNMDDSKRSKKKNPKQRQELSTKGECLS